MVKELEIALELEKFLGLLVVLKDVTQAQFKAEAELTKKLQKLFGKAFDSVYAKFISLDSVPSNEPARAMLISELSKIRAEFEEAVSDSAVEAANLGRLRVAGVSGSDLKDFSKHFSDLIKNHVFISSERTFERMIGDVMFNLSESYEQGLGIEKAGERLKETFNHMEKYELNRVARTEIQSHQNEGAHQTLIDLGIQYEQWWTAEDERVRGNDPNDEADHVSMHGQIVRTGDAFSNGLLYPGDRGGPIEEWINCRCRTVPFLMPEGMSAPTGMNYFYEGDLIPIGSPEKPENIVLNV